MINTAVTEDDLSKAVKDGDGLFSADKTRFYGIVPQKSPLIYVDLILDGAELEIICDDATKDLKHLRKVQLPSNIKAIGYNAFKDVITINEINLPVSLKYLFANPFENVTINKINCETPYYCIDGKAIYTPNYRELVSFYSNKAIYIINHPTREIGECAFANNSHIKAVSLEYTKIITINNNAFKCCPDLQELILPDTLEKIGDKAFLHTHDLDCYVPDNGIKNYCTLSITLPKSVLSIGKCAFNGIDKVISYSPYFTTTTNALYNKDKTRLIYYFGKNKHFTVPESVTEIDKYAFAGNSYINSITISQTVKVIGEYAFSYCCNLNKVTLLGDYTVLGNWIFNYCKKLRTVCLPNGLTIIPEGAFYSCTTLESITIPNKVKTISYCSFSDCKSLTMIELPEDLITIEESAFESCEQLKEILLPDKVKEIKEDAFRSCSALETVTLSQSLDVIESGAFMFCTNLKHLFITNPRTKILCDFEFSNDIKIHLPKGARVQDYVDLMPYDYSGEYGINRYHKKANIIPFIDDFTLDELLCQPSYGDENVTNDDNIFDYKYGKTCFVGIRDRNKSIEHIVIEEGTKYICNGALKTDHSYDIKEIDIPQSVIAFGSKAFEDTSISKIKVPSSLIYIGDYAFNNTNLETITIPKSVTYIGKNPFHETNRLHKIISKSPKFRVESFCLINNETKEVIHCFQNCHKKNEITANEELLLKDTEHTICYIPEGITHIGENSFSTAKITCAIIPNTARSIGESAFMFNSTISTISIPDSVTKINKDAFAYCYRLESISLPKSIQVIEAGCLNSCPKLSKIKLPNTVLFVNNTAFKNCDSLTQVILSNSLKVIGKEAFYGCKKLKKINIPDSLYTIGDLAFAKCDLRSFTIPKNVKQIGINPFADNKDIQIKSNSPFFVIENKFLLTQDKKILICYFGSDKKVVIPSQVETINESAFYANKVIETIQIPPSVKEIRSRAFCNCISLIKIIFDKCMVKSILPETFKGCKKLEHIVLPEYVQSISQYAFESCNCLKSISFPHSINYIDDKAFDKCNSIESIYFPSGREEVKVPYNISKNIIPLPLNVFNRCIDESGVVFSLDKKQLLAAPHQLIKYKVPEGTIEICNYAFYGCNVSEITIPNSVKKIGDNVFSPFFRLKKIHMPQKVEFLGAEVFHNPTDNIIIIPSTIKHLSYNPFIHSYYKSDTTYKIKNESPTLAIIDDFLYSADLSRLISYLSFSNDTLYILNTVGIIGKAAFKHCHLNHVVIPTSVNTIEEDAFLGSNIKYLTIANPNIHFDVTAFKECRSLKKIIVPHNRKYDFIKKLPDYKDIIEEDPLYGIL